MSDDNSPNGAPGKRVTGLGGVFFKCDDAAAQRDWYSKHLGVPMEEWGGSVFQWREVAQPDERGYTVWCPFKSDTDYFAPSDKQMMLNMRVHDLPALLVQLEAEGVQLVGAMEEHPNGKFAWCIDPEGYKVELWEPVPSAEDPYLPAAEDTAAGEITAGEITAATDD